MSSQDQQQLSDSQVLSTYQPSAAGFDEAVDSEGHLREHWAALLGDLDALGRTGLHDRHIKLQRILRDDGATYKTYSNQQQSWDLDPVPLVLTNESWQAVEQGLVQRAEVFNRLFKDIYGQQDLIRQGVIPPEAIFAHPGFLRPCYGLGIADDHALLLHGVDMIRTKDRSICVVGDRTQSPSGAGYALENRTVMTRVFPNLFRDNQVHRLAMFFQTLRHKLNELSPNSDLPNIVVLTPGSISESYFEHAYLANYLGYTLVQGRDLVVRNGFVWTKSLNGLSRVDVILRRVDDYFCDPAELKSDSYFGVPGLLEVIRAGKVAVANPLGSGILESPIFLKYLNDISHALGVGDLDLPSAETWWAFDAQDRECIFDNFDDLIIKPISRNFQQHSVLVSQLNEKEKTLLREQINERPLRYAAQRYIPLSCAPAWQSRQFVPRPTILRSFVVAGHQQYRAMPGGLTRQGATEKDIMLTSQLSHWSKDTWVLANEPEPQVNQWSSSAGHIAYNGEQAQDLPSRVIENMFWLGRYAVRAEYALRLLRSVFVQLNDTHQLSKDSYRVVLKAVTQTTETYPGFTAKDSLLFENPEAELISVTINADRAGSVISSLYEMLHCAEEVKVLLSADTQRVINDIRDNVSVLEKSIHRDFTSAPEEALDPLVTSLLALSGLIRESMIRGYGWRFIEIGRNLERAYQTMSLIEALMIPVLNEHDENSVLETLLLTLETLITYRRRYRARTDVINGLELTVLDDTNPRSLNFILQELHQHIEALPKAGGNRFLSKESRVPLTLLRNIQLIDPIALCEVEQGDTERKSLAGLLGDSKKLVNELAIILSDKFFDHIEQHQHIEQTTWDEE